MTARSRIAHWAAALLAGVTCFVVSVLVPDRTLSVALISAGAVFTFSGALLGLWRLPARRRAASANVTLEALLADDPAPCLLCTSDFALHFANDAARRNFAADASLPGLLRGRLAHPAALLQRLGEEVARSGRASEDVIVGDGALRVTGRDAGDGLTLWRVEDFSAPPTGEAGVPTLAVGRKGAVLAMNTAARALLGRRVRALSELIPGDAVKDGAIHDIPVATGTARYEFRSISAGPGRSEIALLPAPDTGAVSDILLETLPIALLKVAADGAILAANREARALLELDGIDGVRLGMLFEGLGRPIADWLSDAAEGRGLNRPEFLRLSRAREETFLQVALTRGGGLDLIAVMTDATELKTLEAQFVQSQKMQAIGQLAGGIAHDFNNLLTAISGHCDLLLLRHTRGDQDYDDLVQINQNANRAAALVGQLLAFSRKQPMKAELLDLRETLSDLTHLLNRLVGAQITLELRHEPALPAIRGDRRQLEQVMMNLVVNARDAMPEGGRILVETERLTLSAPLRRDRAMVEPGDYVVVKVTDTGTGIPPDQVRKVFEPFYTTKRSGEGTGLGLSTVYGIIKQTGGFIFLDSEVGKGTTFKLIFPAQSATARRDAAPAAIPARKIRDAADAAEGVVLIVEDEAPVRAFAARGLRLKGLTVIEADSGEAALDILSDPGLSVDLIVSDMIMPGLDGPTWVRQAREDRPETGVIFVSGYAADSLGDSAGDVGNATFLQKPFSLNQLAQAVHDRLRDEDGAMADDQAPVRSGR
ncbi:hybrid sensor histidine kinase/response regulator [Roseivivax sediminis]|uniref:hybrid sensor histidine kinase/response regulator n=1 Tax=Roseivivax sediminis TaxID=936889 RepID=UPI001CB73578|nr:ATP-binding protein [Roseivivax sediminis]